MGVGRGVSQCKVLTGVCGFSAAEQRESWEVWVAGLREPGRFRKEEWSVCSMLASWQRRFGERGGGLGERSKQIYDVVLGFGQLPQANTCLNTFYWPPSHVNTPWLHLGWKCPANQVARYGGRWDKWANESASGCGEKKKERLRESQWQRSRVKFTCLIWIKAQY